MTGLGGEPSAVTTAKVTGSSNYGLLRSDNQPHILRLHAAANIAPGGLYPEPNVGMRTAIRSGHRPCVDNFSRLYRALIVRDLGLLVRGMGSQIETNNLGCDFGRRVAALRTPSIDRDWSLAHRTRQWGSV